MKVFIILIFAYAAWGSPTRSHKKEADFYWKDYDGYVPRDALDASDSSSPEAIYVGQGYFQDVGLLSGTLYPDSPTLKVIERGNILSLDKNVKILCTKHAVNVRWIEINAADVACLRRLGGIVMANGGVEQDVPVLIGRHKHEGSMQVGKVYPKAPYEGLHLLNKNGGGTHYRNFEILVYV